jgi:hypothetical protein
MRLERLEGLSISVPSLLTLVLHCLLALHILTHRCIERIHEPHRHLLQLSRHTVCNMISYALPIPDRLIRKCYYLIGDLKLTNGGEVGDSPSGQSRN